MVTDRDAKNSITLRGHHLLCVHGFRGMGYSPAFAVKMKEIVERIRDHQDDFPIRVVHALDDTCQYCPNKGEGICVAAPTSEEHVQAMDLAALEQLGLIPGHIYRKSELIERTKNRVEPADLDRICAGCSWLSYGVCKKGIALLKENKYMEIDAI
ncbi:iron-sulfur binding protein [Brevibacillus laterosporus]|uniref:DUF1284 domain-containing protein n=1 Tax=Brevibacillus laterosporus TaxID=1465 RepID=UPI000BDD5A4E|nr:DUF1284 domain-containing protein [Brevibacillus laterosporus]PCN44941.1 iron-sulfur binding protein [Brevibacillus laterosporus]